MSPPCAGTTDFVQICSSAPSAASRNGTPSGRALRIAYRTLTVGRDDLGAPVQELPTAYKPVRFHRLPLRGTASIHMKELSFYWVWFGDISSTENIVRRGPVVVSKQKQ